MLAEKNTPHRSCELFNLRQNEVYSLEASISDSSEKQPSRARVKVGIYLVEVGLHANQHMFLQKVAASHWGVEVTMKGFNSFLDMRRCKNQTCKTFSWKICSSSFPQGTACLNPDHCPELLWAVLKVSDCRGLWHCRGRRQVTIFRLWHIYCHHFKKAFPFTPFQGAFCTMGPAVCLSVSP